MYMFACLQMDPLDRAVDAFKANMRMLQPYNEVLQKTQRRRRVVLEELVKTLFVNPAASVRLLPNGDLLIPCGTGEEDSTGKEAVRVWDLARRMGLSVRDTYKMARTCTRKELDLTRARLTPYNATTHRVTAANMPQRSAAVASLAAVVREQVRLAVACNTLARHNPSIWVLICPDATPLWHTSATKCDIFVHLWGGEEGGVRAAGNPARWVMWWALDGPDDSHCLRAMDMAVDLNSAISALEDEDLVVGGERVQFLCFLTGDGKAMKAMNPGEGCWCCNDPTSLQPMDGVGCGVRWGAFLRGIPVERRVGDFAHAQCRVANMFIIRLREQLGVWGRAGVPGTLGAVGKLNALWGELLAEAACIPPSERLAPRKTPDGAVDISTARLFWEWGGLQEKIVAVLHQHYGSFRASGAPAYALIRLVLASFSALHALWRKKERLTDEDVHACKENARKFGLFWGKLGWAPTPWVHWVASHSGFFVEKYRSLYLFSSIPSEHRNRRFKRALKNSMRGWCMRHPTLATRGLAHVLNMESLDVGLLYQKAQILREKCLLKKRRSRGKGVKA
jgi:hypothetical protein